MKNFWKAALGVAGIGALGFFVFWSLYRQWLSLSIFPMLTQEQAYELLKIFLFLTFISLLFAVIAYLFTHNISDKNKNFVPIQSVNLTLPNGSRFTDEQFATYKNVWIALQNLRNAGEDLWNHANTDNLDAFAVALRKAKKMIDIGSIFFTQADFAQLEELLDTFAEYQIGKGNLIEMRHADEFQMEDIREQIEHNKNHLVKYSKLLKRIRINYHDRLSWKTAI
jgi:hypothetical protein